MKTLINLFFWSYLIFSVFSTNAQSFPTKNYNKINTWIKAYNTTNLNSCRVIFINQYGDEEIHSFRDSIIGLNVHTVAFVSIAINNQILFEAPCFAGDTMLVDFTNKRYSYNNQSLTDELRYIFLLDFSG